MYSREQKIERGQLLIAGVSCGAIYPRSLTEVIHLVIYEGIDWNEIGSNTHHLLDLFEQAWMKYTGLRHRSQFTMYDQFVFEDFEAQLVRSLAPEQTFAVDADIYHFPTTKVA